ncbi:MAG: 2-dehydropantoate 2-reductase N-terminal domain-containing protein [Gammaproteobacteria bacterium]|nr:2-dehydropantoate 2-reductase N-terminal domain-containing protein [Gammaproteobacteria bacterium]
MRYIIYGAGAVGGTIGARLFKSGADVLLIARGQHPEAIRRDGLHYRNPEMDEHLRIPAVGHPDEIEFADGDVVILTMKSQHTDGALTDLAPAAPPEIPIVCCQNGVANEFLAARRFRHVYAQVVWLPGTHLQPGEVLHHATSPGALLDAGCFPVGTDETIEALCRDFTAAGFSANADPRPLRLKYAKLLQNLGNSLQAVCDAGRDAADIMRLARNEATACYEAAGIDAASRDETRERLDGTMQIGEIEGASRGGGSSWQSLHRGTGDIEADYLNGEICLLGKLHGVPTPANEVLRTLANRVARERLPPGQFTVDEVMAQIEALDA